MDYIPYTYYIKSKINGKKYYGVKYAKGCNPSQFWVSYFTSSKVIKNFVEEFGTDSFEVRVHKTFHNDPEAAILFEQKMLRRMKCHLKSDWFNMCLNDEKPMFYRTGVSPHNKGLTSPYRGKKFYHNGEIQKMYLPGSQPDGWIPGRLNKSWNAGLNKTTDDRVNRIAELNCKPRGTDPWNKGLTKDSDDRLMNVSKNIISKLESGDLIPHRRGGPPKGHTFTLDKNNNVVMVTTEEFKSNDLKGINSGKMIGYKHKPITCPHCNSVGGSNVMKKHHFDRCKKKK